MSNDGPFIQKHECEIRCEDHRVALENRMERRLAETKAELSQVDQQLITWLQRLDDKFGDLYKILIGICVEIFLGIAALIIAIWGKI
jgi:hypothetical protein